MRLGLVRLWLGIVCLVVFVVLALAGCDRVLTPEEARAIPGSIDYCSDLERTIVSPGSHAAFMHAKAAYRKHCLTYNGGGSDGDDETPNIQRPR